MNRIARTSGPLSAALLLAAACASATGAAFAQAWPAKPVRMIVPIAGGGSTDAIARLVGTKLGEAWGHAVLVENRPGGSTMIGAEVVARSAPDGYTMLMATSAFPANFSLFRKVPYKLADFAPISNVAESPNVLAVHPSVPAKNVKELIALLRSRPGQINYGSGGVGGSTHLAAELFKLLAKVDVVHIPYKGGGPAVTDLLGGQISMIFGNLPAVLPHVKSGRINVLAIASMKRSPTMPDLPTMDEAGVRGFEASTWAGLLMPAGTPQPIIDRFYADLQKIYAQADMKQRMATGGFEAVGSSPKEFAAYLDAEVARWEKVIRAAGIKAE
ncbi:MAG: tripartite tricarboxylate transporter substrate binding protein [bacterium]|jgi:tripartite-type tricarboxylate transporter receptor subunit TctC|nr:tripartite tricarboxylate transporter substrate binding protein [Betaproteobacteria bacterium]